MAARGPKAALLLLCCLLAAGWCLSAAAQQARANGAGGEPAFVGDAQSLSDLEESGFVGNGDGQQPFDDFGEDSTAGNASADGFGLVVAGSPAAEVQRLENTGTAVSAYSETPIESFGAMDLACGFGYVDPDFQATYVGVGSSFYSKGFSCGRCIKLQCDDQSCKEPGRSTVALVVDLCGDCYDADLSLAIPGFTNLTGREANPNPTVAVSWEYVECAPYIEGSIKMLIKKGGNAYFQAFNFANAIIPITAVQVNGNRLQRGTSGYWEWNPGQAINPRGPFNVALLGSNKEVLRVRLNELKNQDLKVQFKKA